MPTQIRLHRDGEWHRRDQGDGNTTGCGEAIGSHASRDSGFDDNLCTICFTPHEIEMGTEERVVREVAREGFYELTDPSCEAPDTDRTDIGDVIRAAQGEKTRP